MQNAIKTDLQRRNSAPFLNLINPLVTAGTFCLSCFFKIRVIHRFHVKTGIQNFKHFDVFYPYLRKNNVDNLKRNGLWNTLDANNSEIKEENACFILMTTYDVLCKEHSRVWMILLFIWQTEGKANELRWTGRLWCSGQMSLLSLISDWRYKCWTFFLQWYKHQSVFRPLVWKCCSNSFRLWRAP